MQKTRARLNKILPDLVAWAGATKERIHENQNVIKTKTDRQTGRQSDRQTDIQRR